MTARMAESRRKRVHRNGFRRTAVLAAGGRSCADGRGGKPVPCGMLRWGHRTIDDPAMYSFQIYSCAGECGEIASGRGCLRGEKFEAKLFSRRGFGVESTERMQFCRQFYA